MLECIVDSVNRPTNMSAILPEFDMDSIPSKQNIKDLHRDIDDMI